ncbi:MAG: hypothetical protein AAB320_05920 [Elusimicrobiota bacterium]
MRTNTVRQGFALLLPLLLSLSAVPRQGSAASPISRPVLPGKGAVIAWLPGAPSLNPVMPGITRSLVAPGLVPIGLTPVMPAAQVLAVTAAAPQDNHGVTLSVEALSQAGEDGRLESAIPVVFDASVSRPAASEPETLGSQGAPSGYLSPAQHAASGRSASPDEVRSEYSVFLSKLGFRDYSAQIDANLRDERQTAAQKTVLEFNRERYRVIDAARDLAAEVMVGLAEQGYSKGSVERAVDLAARLISLQPIAPPSTLPPEVAAKDKDGIVAWLSAVTVQRIGQHLTQIVSDVVKTVVAPKELAGYTKDIENPSEDAEQTKQFVRRVVKIKAMTETLLVSAYTDSEIGQTRYAGRALAAALVRLSRNGANPGIEKALSQKLRERGLYLENFVGDTLVLHDVSQPGKAARFKLRSGDFLGERSGGREAAEITFAVRPAYRLWLKAWRQDLTGRMLGLWANPKAAPHFVAGQSLRNKLKFGLWKLKKWVAARPFMEKGYSHVGMASVEAADGVAMAWAMDNYPNASAGGIRKIGITEQFSQNGPYLRLGMSHMDADKVWESYTAAAAKNGYQETVYASKDGDWPSRIGREDFERLAALPKSRSKELLAELNARAVSVLEEMLTRFGVGFAYGFSNELWSAYCSSTMMLAYNMGGQFEIQTYRDMWNPIILLMKRLGIGDAKDQNTDGRIIWPGSLFLDPMVAKHDMARFPEFTAVGRLPDPNTMPAYVEMDPALTKALVAMVRLSSEGSIEPDGGVIDHAIRTHLDRRGDKSRNKNGYRSGASHGSGYSAGLEALLGDGDDD